MVLALVSICWLAGTCSKLSFICLLLLYLFSITLLAPSYWYQAIKILIMLLQALQGLKDGNEQKSMDFTHQRKLKKSFYNIPTIPHIRNGVCCLFLDKMNDLLTNKGSKGIRRCHCHLKGTVLSLGVLARPEDKSSKDNSIISFDSNHPLDSGLPCTRLE